MILIAGKIYIRPGSRESFLASSAESMKQARDTMGCRDFVVAADPIESDRVNVYEEWETQQALDAFRGEGPSEDLSSMIVRAEVAQHVVT